MAVNPIELIQRFNEFKRSFQGDPKQEVERLVASGQISQKDLHDLQQMANQFMQIMRGVGK